MKNLKKTTAIVCLSLSAYCVAYTSAKIVAPEFQIVEVETGFQEGCLLMGGIIFQNKGRLICADHNSNVIGVSK